MFFEEEIKNSKILHIEGFLLEDPELKKASLHAMEIAKENNFDVFVYGHTHNQNIKWEGNTLFINPGSPTNPLPPFVTRPSVALLRITEGKIAPEIVYV